MWPRRCSARGQSHCQIAIARLRRASFLRGDGVPRLGGASAWSLACQSRANPGPIPGQSCANVGRHAAARHCHRRGRGALIELAYARRCLIVPARLRRQVRRRLGGSCKEEGQAGKGPAPGRQIGPCTGPARDCGLAALGARDMHISCEADFVCTRRVIELEDTLSTKAQRRYIAAFHGPFCATGFP